MLAVLGIYKKRVMGFKLIDVAHTCENIIAAILKFVD
jgi:hypothetical protein